MRLLLMLFGFLQLFFLVHCYFKRNQVHFVAQNLDPKLNSQVDQLVRNHWNQELIYLYYGTYFTRADVALHGFGKFFHQRSLDVGAQRVNITTMINKRGGYVSFGQLKVNGTCDTIEKNMEEHTVSLNMDNEPFSCLAYICRFLKKDESENKNNNNNEDNDIDYLKKKDKKKERYGKRSKTKEYLKKKNENCDMELRDIADWRPAMYALRDLIAMEKFVVHQVLNVVYLAGGERYGDAYMRHCLEEYIQEPTRVIKLASGLMSRLRAFQDEDDYFVGEFLLDKELESNNGTLV